MDLPEGRKASAEGSGEAGSMGRGQLCEVSPGAVGRGQRPAQH